MKKMIGEFYKSITGFLNVIFFFSIFYGAMYFSFSVLEKMELTTHKEISNIYLPPLKYDAEFKASFIKLLKSDDPLVAEEIEIFMKDKPSVSTTIFIFYFSFICVIGIYGYAKNFFRTGKISGTFSKDQYIQLVFSSIGITLWFIVIAFIKENSYFYILDVYDWGSRDILCFFITIVISMIVSNLYH